jgi:hypothetical protein
VWSSGGSMSTVSELRVEGNHLLSARVAGAALETAALAVIGNGTSCVVSSGGDSSLLLWRMHMPC